MTYIEMNRKYKKKQDWYWSTKIPTVRTTAILKRLNKEITPIEVSICISFLMNKTKLWIK